MELRLEAVEFVDLTRWRWVLAGDSGTFVAGHEVRLDPSSWQFEAFADLWGYLAWNAPPHRRAQEETRIVSAVGEWIGSEVFGPVAAALVKASPATVRVVVPAGAEELLTRPLELGHVGGKPLAVQDVTLVMETGPASRRVSPVGRRLRVLGLFSLPAGRRALNLRRERHSLVQLINGITASGKAADVRVLQYGVTRDRLQDVLADDEGWDVIHVSGHGSPGQFVLETAAGEPDLVTASQLTDLLEPVRGRLKLVTVSACWSAALAVADQRRLLGLPVQDKIATERAGDLRDAGTPPGSLAAELARRLDCTVLAMRFPVGDEFAIALAGQLYQRLVAAGQSLPQAVATSLRELASDPRYAAFPALSLATPALFGTRAIDLRLAAPERGQPDDHQADARNQKMAGFPSQPERFVGRTAVMARASAALARRGGVPGVLLHGTPGGGKTACALELAYGQEHAFDQLIWYQAPDEGMDTTSALTGFALTLERYLDGFLMASEVIDEARLTAFLPRLTSVLERRRLLLVIDNAESLLTEAGEWRDDRWRQVADALTAHTGLGRLILTSRRIPAGLPELPVEPVDALSADEALLLARELPHLRALSRGDITGIDRQTARQLARRALDAAWGHPKLLELAEGQAADPERLVELVRDGGQAWRKLGKLPDGFFAAGKSAVSGQGYLDVLTAWTGIITRTLTPGEQDLFWFLCCLEEPDRQRPVLAANWAGLWTALGRHDQPPGCEAVLSVLAVRSLIAIRASATGAGESYAIHPAIAAAGRQRAGKPFQDAVDAEVSRYWAAVFAHATGGAGEVTDTAALTRAGLAEVPYLMRQQQWVQAAAMVERAFNRDPSKSNAIAVRPAIEQIVAHEERAAGVLARVLMAIDPAGGERRMRAHMAAAAARGDYSPASIAAMWLVDLCFRSGRLTEAVALADQMIGYTGQAGHGPWTQLLDQATRLQVLNAMGDEQASQVLAEVRRLRTEMGSLPPAPGENEVVTPWNVREVLLDIGRNAARRLEQWQDALDLNAEVVASKRERNAPAVDIGQARFSDYYPLLKLGRADEALALLQRCRQVFADAEDIRLLGMALTGLAEVENERGHGDAAIRLAHDALYYKYLAGNTTGIAISYHNLGDYLLRHARQPASALASHLAAALIGALTGAEGAGDSVHAAAMDLREAGPDAMPPADVADLSRQLGGIPGTDLMGLLAEISPGPDITSQVFRLLIEQARFGGDPPPPAG